MRVSAIVSVGFFSLASLWFAVQVPGCIKEREIALKVAEYKSLSYEQVIKTVSTPEQAQWYVENCITPFSEDDDEFLVRHSFRLTHETGRGDCDDAAVAAAAMLQDDGYPPKYMRLTGYSGGHVVYLYFDFKKELYGVVSIWPNEFSKPRFKSLDELARWISSRNHRYMQYLVSTFDEGGIIPDWVFTNKSLYVDPKEHPEHEYLKWYDLCTSETNH